MPSGGGLHLFFNPNVIPCGPPAAPPPEMGPIVSSGVIHAAFFGAGYIMRSVELRGRVHLSRVQMVIRGLKCQWRHPTRYWAVRLEMEYSLRRQVMPKYTHHLMV